MGVAQKIRTTPGGIARIGVAPQVGLEPTTLRLTVLPKWDFAPLSTIICDMDQSLICDEFVITGSITGHFRASVPLYADPHIFCDFNL